MYIGERGDYGYFGAVGQKGEASFSGKLIFAFSTIQGNNNSITEFISTSFFLKGVKGEMGQPGLTGPHGYNGRTGPRGPKGEEGDAGLGKMANILVHMR